MRPGLGAKLHAKAVCVQLRHAKARAVYRDAIAKRGAVSRTQSQQIAAKARNLRDLSDQSVKHYEPLEFLRDISVEF